MSATGLDTFDRTIQTTHLWLHDIEEVLGPDRQVAWRSLGAVLHALRDRLPLEVAVHLGAQLPLLVRGLYYDQWHLHRHPEPGRDAEAFRDEIARTLHDLRPVNPDRAAHAVFTALTRHVDPGQIAKVREALPKRLRALWAIEAPPPAEA